jgi:hypothetical protein
MTEQNRIVSPGPDERSARTTTGEILHPPLDWSLLPPGDATLTRRVKASGPTWTVQEKHGLRTFSRGIWAPASVVAAVQGELASERSSPAYEKQRAASVRRRQKEQASYVEDFSTAVLNFLAFDPCHAELARRLARAVTEHATPVGSGTVARTQRIPIEQRAEAAVIAWLRHKTTAYDHMKIPRVRGKRREVRTDGCPLQQALRKENAS